MSAEPSGPAVVAFGAGDAEADGPGPFAERVRRVVGDRRVLSLTVTVLAGVAGCMSLFAPWFSTVLPLGRPDPNTGNETDRLTEFHLGDLGTLATGYLMGLLILAVAGVLALAGPPAARRAARLSGFTVAGVSAAMLVALTATIENYIARTFFFLYQDDFEIENRSGLITAFLAVVLAGLALFLSGRLPAAPEDTEVEHGWRPPRPIRDETAAEIAAAAPLDLTVQPARPFTHPNGDDRTR